MQDKRIESGLMLVNKPLKWTSNDVVQFVKHHFGFKKVGHSGTLDPEASGLLILGINDYTKKLNQIIHFDKTYNVTIKFHYSSETYDQGAKEIFCHFNERKISIIDIEFAIAYFLQLKDYFQTPPKFSALKINGHKAYELARRNINFEIRPRLVKIFNINNFNFNEEKQMLDLSIKCSSGFYVRSFAIDFAAFLNSSAVVVNLTRLSIDNFNLINALSIDEIKQNKNPEEIESLLEKYLIK